MFLIQSNLERHHFFKINTDRVILSHCFSIFRKNRTNFELLFLRYALNIKQDVEHICTLLCIDIHHPKSNGVELANMSLAMTQRVETPKGWWTTEQTQVAVVFVSKTLLHSSFSTHSIWCKNNLPGAQKSPNNFDWTFSSSTGVLNSSQKVRKLFYWQNSTHFPKKSNKKKFANFLWGIYIVGWLIGIFKSCF